MVTELRYPRFLTNRLSSGSSNSIPSDTSLFDGLSEEEIVEILRRLPLKLANQCKCVSKNWLNLISSSHFARSYLRFHHHNSSITPPQFAIVHRYRGLVGPGLFRETPSSSSAGGGGVVKLTLARPALERNVVPRNDPSYIDYQFLAPSNGWVLCSFPDPSGECYYVVNPLTKHEIALPPIPRTSDKLCRVGFIFCVDGDSNTSSSRVVRFPPSDKIGGTSLELDIFSSETREWNKSTLLFSSDRTAKRAEIYDCPLNNHALALNGKLHWLHVWFEIVYDPYTPKKYHRLSLPEE